jgi:hypothetical protein
MKKVLVICLERIRTEGFLANWALFISNISLDPYPYISSLSKRAHSRHEASNTTGYAFCAVPLWGGESHEGTSLSSILHQ